MSTSPYRARPPGPVSTVVVPVFVLPRRLLVLLAVIVTAPTLLHVFLWSRVVNVRCERGAKQQISCQVDEESLALSNHSRKVATGAVVAAPRGKTSGSRGDAWLVLVGPDGETRLTSGFNRDKPGQRAAAETLTTFLQTPGARSVEVSFGSRWFTAWILGGLFSLMLLLGYPMLGQRLRATADRNRDTLDLHRRVWPLPGTRVSLPLQRFVRFDIESLPRGRYRLVAMMDDGQAHPLTWPIGAGEVLVKTAERLNTWAAAERAEYRDRGQSVSGTEAPHGPGAA